MKKLSQLGIGERATVVAVNGEGAVRRHAHTPLSLVRTQ